MCHSLWKCIFFLSKEPISHNIPQILGIIFLREFRGEINLYEEPVKTSIYIFDNLGLIENLATSSRTSHGERPRSKKQ
jgi:hypothetical protein